MRGAFAAAIAVLRAIAGPVLPVVSTTRAHGCPIASTSSGAPVSLATTHSMSGNDCPATESRASWRNTSCPGPQAIQTLMCGSS